MGAWGHRNFQNDTALDWICDLKPSSAPFDYPSKAIDQLLASDLYIDADECSNAIAAAESIAAAMGNAPTDPPEELQAWNASLMGKKPDATLIEQATTAIEKVRNDEQSELRQLWSESNDDGQPDPQWLAAIDDLLNRLSKPSA